ncbi:hypothetical protein MAUB_42560 [Mycolicibacterium aubagnense]|uniref:Lipoprotein n=1 Tax=Mycolicibacterium aubagnense TaxID=319707 RepID=A0ABM7II17_9MYCO|nr:hypothetical protein MAUB_42560 [Mycolicibacterium aubagnense]
MMYAQFAMLALLLVMLGAAGCAMVSRLLRIRPTRLSDQRAVPLISKPHRTRLAPRDYRTGASARLTGLRLAIERSHARRAQRRRKQKEFQAWLEITSEPL